MKIRVMLKVLIILAVASIANAAAPDAPQVLTASVSGNTVTISFTPATSGDAATGYVVQAGSSPGSSDIAVINVAGATSLTATAPPGTYYVRVIALNAAGASAASREIVVAVGAPAARAATIEFGGLAGGANREPIATYSESGFMLAATAQDDAHDLWQSRPVHPVST